jgi:hypothetical protein
VWTRLVISDACFSWNRVKFHSWADGHAFLSNPSQTPTTDAYKKVQISDPDVQTAVKVAIADQQKTEKAIRLRTIISAERPAVSSSNLRLCLSMDRSGNAEFARVVLARNAKKQWFVTIWSWGSYGH